MIETAQHARGSGLFAVRGGLSEKVTGRRRQQQQKNCVTFMIALPLLERGEGEKKKIQSLTLSPSYGVQKRTLLSYD